MNLNPEIAAMPPSPLVGEGREGGTAKPFPSTLPSTPAN